jgi:hemolysin III
MNATPATTAERPQTLREEIANALSHGLGFLLAAASLPVVVDLAARQGSRASVVGASVFSLTMMLLYFASMVYHALPHGRAKRWFLRLDHAAIFLFIAGSYTPFALATLHTPRGLAAFAAVWALALLGMALKALGRLRNAHVSTAIYVALGWLALLAALPTVERIAQAGLLLLVGGGLAYMVGAVFFLVDHRLRYGHFVWHLFVLMGSSCHFFAALWHVA